MSTALPEATGTDFGRVRHALLRTGQEDRAPLFELSVDRGIKQQILGRPISGPADEVAFWQAAGYDFVPIRAGVRSVVRGLHPAVKSWLRERESAQPPGIADGWVSGERGIVTTRAELASFPWPRPEDLGGYNDYANLETYLGVLRGCLPSNMKIIAQLGYLFMGAWQLLGFENFCVQLADDPEFVQEVVARLATSQLGVLEMLLAHDSVGAIFLPDDLCYNSGPVVAPRVYKMFIYPWYRRICDRCHAAGLPAGLHSDGDLGRLLPDLVACGFDCLHPLEPPLNDIVAVKRTWGRQIAVAGNIDLKATLCAGTPEAVEREVKEKAAHLAAGGGWLVGSSNSIPDFVPIENYRALLAASLRNGRRYAPEATGGGQ